MRFSCPDDQRELVQRVGVGFVALEDLHHRADRGERVADLVGDAGRQQAEGRHLLLVQDVSLGFLQFGGALGDARLQFGLLASQRLVECPQMVADALEQQCQARCWPR